MKHLFAGRPFSALFAPVSFWRTSRSKSLCTLERAHCASGDCKGSVRKWSAAVKVALLISGLLNPSWAPLVAQTISLGSAQSFAVLAGTTVTNTGSTIITGNLGVSPGTAVTGFPPGIVFGTTHAGDAVAAQAQADVATAYATLAGETVTTDLSGQDLGGLTLTPGVYHFASAAALTGTLSLDTTSDPTGTFIFQIGSTLTTAASSAVTLLGPKADPNIFWQVGSVATLGGFSVFNGSILAATSIALNAGAGIQNGRALALNGAVTLNMNQVAFSTTDYWNGIGNNSWSGTNWSTDTSGSSSSTLVSGADVVFSVTGITPIRQDTLLDVDATISSLTVNDPAAVTISGAHTLSITGSGITINSGAGLTTINSNLQLSGSPEMTVNSVAGLVINGTVGGTVGLTKDGPGTLSLTGVNTYTGGTRVAEGILSVSTDGALGDVSGGITLQGGELLTTVDGFLSNRLMTLNVAQPPNTLAAATGTTATYLGVISGSGGLTVGDGTNLGTVFVGSGANTYSGGTTVTSGATLLVNSDNDLGNTSGGITLVGGGKLVTGQFSTSRTLLLNGGGILAALDTGQSWTAAYNGQISGAGGLTIGDANSSTLTVVLTNANNNYLGGTTITGGATLEVDGISDTVLGNSSGGIILNGGIFHTTVDGFVSPRPITLVSNVDLFPNALQADSSTTATYSGIISGSGALEINGGGTVVLSGANTYLGGTRITFFGVLSVANNGNLGNLSGGLTLASGTLLTTVNGFSSARPVQLVDIEGPDTLAAVNNTTATYTGPISGDGHLFIGDFNFQTSTPDGGVVVFTNPNNSYTAGTTITNNATLSVRTDGNLGAPNGPITLNDGELLTTGDGFNSARRISLQGSFLSSTLAAATGTTATYSGVISGSQLLAVGDFVNGGTVVLSGNNTYTGGTEVQGIVDQVTHIPVSGTLVAASDHALGIGPVSMQRGILKILAGVTIDNVISFVEGGIVNNAGTVTHDITDSFSVAEVVINSGLINANVTLGGGHDIVQLFTGSTITGHADLGPTTNAQLILDGSGNELLSQGVHGAITDNGTLTKQGSGFWTIDRPFSAPLGTDILAGTLVLESALTTALVNITPGAALQLNNGGSTGKLIDNGSLIFAKSDTITYNGIIGGTGNLIQEGTGTTILSGKNTYGGGTIVNLGTLLVNNPQALGTGNVTVNGGVLGADPQPINVLGNYTQKAGGTLQLNIAGRDPGQFDTLNVTGTASLNGNLSLLNLGYQPQNNDKLQLITAGGVVSGRFSKLQNPFAFTAGFDTIALIYALHSVTLEFLKRNVAPSIIMTTDFASFAFTPNQSAVGAALNRVQLTTANGRLIDFLNSEPFANLPGDFDRISPDGLSSLYEISFSAANVQASNLEERFSEIRNGSNGFSSSLSVTNAPGTLVEGKDGKTMIESNKNILAPSPENKWGVWISGNGDYVNVSGDGNGHGYDFTTGGVTFGLDYRLMPNLAVGVAGSYAHTWTNLTGSGKIDADSGRAGLYATYFQGGLYLSGYAGGGYNSYSTRRDTLGGAASGSPDGGEFDGYLGGGYEFHHGGFTFGPIASVQYTYLDVSGSNETGSLAPLHIQSKSHDSLRSNVGLSASYTTHLGKIQVTPSVRASWQHEYLYSNLPITAQFDSGAASSFTVTGPSVGQDCAIVNAGVNVQWTPTIGTYFGYNGQLGRDNYDSQGGTCSVHVDF